MDYVIKQGDNLSTIAKANNTTVGALASLNKLSNPNKIVAGQTLKLGVPTTNTNVANTAFNAPITQPQAVPPTINATTIGTQTPIPVPTTMPNNAPTTMPATIPTDNFAESQMLPEPDKTDAQKFQERSIFDILQGTQELAGKSTFEAQQQDLAGVQAKQAEYKAISDKIRSRQAQLQQEYAAINQSPMSFAARSGYESAVRAAAESEIGALNAQAQAVAGDYEMAVQTAQRAVDAKYKPILEKLEIQKAQLEAIKPLLARDEQKQAREMDYLLKQEERKYNERINKEKAISEMTLTALASGAPKSAIDLASKAETTLEAAKILGRYSPETLKYELLKEQIKTEKAQRANINSQIAERANKAPTTPDFKEFQIVNAGYADRINQSNQVLDSNIDTLKNMNYVQFKLATSTSPLASRTLSPEQKQVALAMRNFITAKLRKESGASIAPSEFADARAQYFPTLGDDETTIANKKALRDSVLNNLVLGSGGAYQPTQITPVQNKFQQATGDMTLNVGGTSIIGGVTPTGELSFKLPGTK